MSISWPSRLSVVASWWYSRTSLLQIGDQLGHALLVCVDAFHHSIRQLATHHAQVVLSSAPAEESSGGEQERGESPGSRSHSIIESPRVP